MQEVFSSKLMRLGITAQKVLLLLLGGFALGLSGSPIRYKRIVKDIGYEWRQINRRELYRAIRRLYESKLVCQQESNDGTISMILTRQGKEMALRYKLDEMHISEPKQWDKRWRVIIFDIPERQKRLRDTLRLRLRQLGLLELQKSVLVHPYECRNEIDFIVELFNARRFVRFIEAEHIDNELHLKKKFQLI